MEDPISEAFGPVIGAPCWLVRRGHGSFVTLEFGEPKLEVSDVRPKQAKVGDSESKPVLQRLVTIHGAWHLWIYCCVWQLTLDGVELAHCESDDAAITQGLDILDGQALSRVDVDRGNARSTFAFDLGCMLRTMPAPTDSVAPKEPVDQWMLYQPNGTVLTLRGDGRFHDDPPSDRL